MTYIHREKMIDVMAAAINLKPNAQGRAMLGSQVDALAAAGYFMIPLFADPMPPAPPIYSVPPETAK